MIEKHIPSWKDAALRNSIVQDIVSVSGCHRQDFDRAT